MNRNDSIALIGGDMRQYYLYKLMLNYGYNIIPYSIYNLSFDNSIETISHCSTIILPIPYTKDSKVIYSLSEKYIKIEQLITFIAPHTSVYGGCFRDDFIDAVRSRGASLYDFMDMPCFEINNSIATAEGAIAEAIIKGPINIQGSNSLILGYGKCGRAIGARLKSLNSFTTVSARNDTQLAYAIECGHEILPLKCLDKKINKFQYIFNTIPHLTLNKSILGKVKCDTIIIDIASHPGGTDFEVCRRLGINASLCLSLPGKYSPKSSSQIIYDCLTSTL